MSVLDKFLSIMKLDDEDDFEDDFDFDEEDEFDETPKKNPFKKNNTEDFFEDKKIKKVTPMRQSTRRSSNMEVCVIKPTAVDEAREITETL